MAAKLRLMNRAQRPMKSYTVKYDTSLIRTLSQMKSNLQHPTEQVVDARNAVRYAGGPESKTWITFRTYSRQFLFPLHYYV